MNSKLAIPTMIALAAVVSLALPSVVAESGYGDYKHTWKDGYKKHHKVIEVTGFEGTIKITEGVDKHALKEQVTVSLSEATAAYPDAKKASMGIAINEDGDKFLVWKVIEKSYDQETHIVTKIIHVGDGQFNLPTGVAVASHGGEFTTSVGVAAGRGIITTSIDTTFGPSASNTAAWIFFTSSNSPFNSVLEIGEHGVIGIAYAPQDRPVGFDKIRIEVITTNGGTLTVAVNVPSAIQTITRLG